MKADKILDIYNKKAVVKKRLSMNRRALKLLAKRVERDEQYLEEANAITEVWRGRPLSICEWGNPKNPHIDIYGVGDDLQRYAKIHPNAHNGGETWGLTIYFGYGYGKDTFTGAYWPSKKEVIQAAKDFVVNKLIPEEHFK